MLGTIDYVAPEQIEGNEADPAGDVYGLACVLFETLIGTAPFAAETGGWRRCGRTWTPSRRRCASTGPTCPRHSTS